MMLWPTHHIIRSLVSWFHLVIFRFQVSCSKWQPIHCGGVSAVAVHWPLYPLFHFFFSGSSLTDPISSHGESNSPFDPKRLLWQYCEPLFKKKIWIIAVFSSHGHGNYFEVPRMGNIHSLYNYKLIRQIIQKVGISQTGFLRNTLVKGESWIEFFKAPSRKTGLKPVYFFQKYWPVEGMRSWTVCLFPFGLFFFKCFDK